LKWKKRRLCVDKDGHKALWKLSKGDENNKFYQQYSNHGKNVSIVWEVKRGDGTIATIF
jgi:hypothetical protein